MLFYLSCVVQRITTVWSLYEVGCSETNSRRVHIVELVRQLLHCKVSDLAPDYFECEILRELHTGIVHQRGLYLQIVDGDIRLEIAPISECVIYVIKA